MKPLSPTQLSLIKAAEFVIFLALSAAVTLAYPLVVAGKVDTMNIVYSALFVFLLVIVFTGIEYLKQSLQAKLIAAVKSGASTVDLQNQLTIINGVEQSFALILQHTNAIAKLVPNITALVTTAQDTAISSLQQVQNTVASAPGASTTTAPPAASTAPVTSTIDVVPTATFGYDVSSITSQTGVIPTVKA